MKSILKILLPFGLLLLLFACEEEEPTLIEEEPEYEVLATYENQIGSLYPDCERDADSSVVWKYIQLVPIEDTELYELQNNSSEIDKLLAEWEVMIPRRETLTSTIPIIFNGELRRNNTNQSIYIFIDSLSVSNNCSCGEIVGQATYIEGTINKGIGIGSNLSYYFMDVPDLPLTQELPTIGNLSNPDLANFGGRICNLPDSIISVLANNENVEVLFSGNYHYSCYSRHSPCDLIPGTPSLSYNTLYDIKLTNIQLK